MPPTPTPPRDIVSGPLDNARTSGTASATASTLVLRDGSGGASFAYVAANNQWAYLDSHFQSFECGAFQTVGGPFENMAKYSEDFSLWARTMTLAEFTVAAGVCIFLITTIAGVLVLSFLSPNDELGYSGKLRNLRRLGRFSNSAQVILSWQEAGTSTQTLKCRLIDISEYSAGVRAKRALALGTQLAVRIPAMRLAGAANVSRCSAARRKFDLGLEFRGQLYRI